MILHDGQRFSRSSCLLFTGVVLSLVGGSSVPYTVAPYKGPLDLERETGLCGMMGLLISPMQNKLNYNFMK